MNKFIALLSLIIIANLGCIRTEQPTVSSVDPGNKLILKGQKFQYQIGQQDKDGRNTKYPVTFKSLNPEIASVNEKGRVTLKKTGEARIKIICKDKSFISRVSVLDGFYSFNYPKEGIFADNGKMQLHETGDGGFSTGYVVNYFGDNKGYLQIGYVIKNISREDLLIDPDNFVMFGGEKEIVKSSNNHLNKRAHKVLLKKQSLAPGETINKLVVFMRPHFNFKWELAKIVYDDGKSPKIVDRLRER